MEKLHSLKVFSIKLLCLLGLEIEGVFFVLRIRKIGRKHIILTLTNIKILSF